MTQPTNSFTNPRRVLRLLFVLAVLYFSWLSMLAVHELGHIVGAVISHGQIVSVSIPLFGFSQTIVNPNPHEQFVVFAGPICGALLPLVACAVFVVCKRRVPDVLRFFAGFCLIANGSYLGLGWINHTGDAADLIRVGTPRVVLILFGLVTVPAGFWIWHITPALTHRSRAGALTASQNGE